MSERFNEDIYERASRVERDPLFESKKLLDELNHILAKLIEHGDLSSSQKQLLRAQIQAQLAKLGLTNLNQLPDFTASLYQGVLERIRNPKVPASYPNQEEFKYSYQNLLIEGRLPNLPGVWSNITASEVAAFAQSDWLSVKGRGTDIVTYSYNLGRVLSDELAYVSVFNQPGDAIQITRNWVVDNGRHRALTLKVLGENYTKTNNLDRWVAVKRDPDLR